MEPHCCPRASLIASRIECGVFRFSRLDEISPIIQFIAAQCPHPHRLSQGLSELMINAIEHGNLGISYNEKSRLLLSGDWHIEIERRLSLPRNQNKHATLSYAAQPDGLILSICDQGNGFDWQPYMDFPTDRSFDPNGRGIAIAKSLKIWDMEYHGTGNLVVCRIPT